ncbi:MAG TPA: hypothetical protein VK147_07460 [Candidatus Didemnitutus sp.]|nr:hypothetical protein [Candidatus Didemnitutus sp.]
MNRFTSITALLFTGYAASVTALACPTCTPTKPSFMDQIVHGAKPQGPFDYAVAIVMIAGVVVTVFASFRAQRNPTNVDP